MKTFYLKGPADGSSLLIISFWSKLVYLLILSTFRFCWHYARQVVLPMYLSVNLDRCCYNEYVLHPGPPKVSLYVKSFEISKIIFAPNILFSKWIKIKWNSKYGNTNYEKQSELSKLINKLSFQMTKFSFPTIRLSQSIKFFYGSFG